jgi:hypothetical protein
VIYLLIIRRKSTCKMPQKSLGGGSGSSGIIKRKNAPAKRKKNFAFDKKGTKTLNKTIEVKAAAKALRNESKFRFTLGELNDRGKQRITEEDKDKERKLAKKRSSADRQTRVVEQLQKRSKNDLE